MEDNLIINSKLLNQIQIIKSIYNNIEIYFNFIYELKYLNIKRINKKFFLFSQKRLIFSYYLF